MLRDMDESSVRAVVKPNWQDLYRAALVELDPVELGKKIDLANAAIYQRLSELARNGVRSSDEQRAMGDALRNLRMIQEIKPTSAPDTAESPDRIAPRAVA
jgi:hypothetical protein